MKEKNENGLVIRFTNPFPADVAPVALNVEEMKHQQQDFRRADGPGYHPHHRHQHQGGDVRHPALYQ